MANDDLGPMHGLSVRVTDLDATVAKVTVEGEVDITNADVLETVLRHLCEVGAIAIDLDLARVGLMDSMGLRALARPSSICRPKVVAASPTVRQVINATGMARVVQLEQ